MLRPRKPPSAKTAKKVPENAIRKLAHKLWLESGCPSGREQENWQEAEQQLQKDWNWLRQELYSWNQEWIALVQFLERRSSALQAVGVILIPVVIFGDTWADQNAREQRDREAQGQEAVKDYLSQLTAVNLAGGLEKNEDLRLSMQAETEALFKDPNLNASHKSQVIAYLARMHLLQSQADSFEETKTSTKQSKSASFILSLERKNLSGFDLSGVDLSGANLEYAILIRANLTGANLSGADLLFANLSKANLRSANLRKADLGGALLVEADLEYADLRWADPEFANLKKANLQHSSLSEANLSHVCLKQACLDKAKLRGTELQWSDLEQATLNDTLLEGADFSMASLFKTDLSRADLKGAIFYTPFDPSKLKESAKEEPSNEQSRTDSVGADEPGRSSDSYGGFGLMYVGSWQADLNEAILLNVKGLTPEQVQSAKNWQFATYDLAFQKQLGLPPKDQRRGRASDADPITDFVRKCR